MFNNILFNPEIMPKMHNSMAKLYEFVADKFRLTGQSAIARKMGESPQVVKNWESRGISESGALTAQLIFGCDANWLRGKSQDAVAVFRTGMGNSAVPIVAESSGGWMWPFRAVSPTAYNTLSEEEKSHIEAGILLTIKNRGHPEKYPLPAYKIARG